MLYLPQIGIAVPAEISLGNWFVTQILTRNTELSRYICNLICYIMSRYGTSIEYTRHSRVLFVQSASICFGNIRTSANIGFGHDEYSRIFVGGYIAASGPIHAPYMLHTSNISPSGRISVLYSSMLGPPMMYITYISSKSSIFETIRVNKGTNTCLIPRYRTSIYSRVRVLVSAAESILALVTSILNEYSSTARVLASI
jgi:hypothetical protein